MSELNSGKGQQQPATIVLRQSSPQNWVITDIESTCSCSDDVQNSPKEGENATACCHMEMRRLQWSRDCSQSNESPNAVSINTLSLDISNSPDPTVEKDEMDESSDQSKALVVRPTISMMKRAFLSSVTLLPAIFIAFDVIQDVTVIRGSLSSNETYSVQGIITLHEFQFGYAMGFIFCISVLLVGIDTLTKAFRLKIVKKNPWLLLVVILASVTNFGPVLFIILKIIVDFPCIRKVYSSTLEHEKDKQMIEAALSSSKAKEALSESFPMLIIVCFKIALSSRVSLLDLLSSMSSAFMLSHLILDLILERISVSLNISRKVTFLFLAGSSMHITVFLIASFAIESERDGLFILVDPSDGFEKSSGLLFLLLITPVIYFCLLPCTIYDVIPVIINGSSTVWQYFLRPPKKIWYLSLTLWLFGYIYIFGIITYFMKRDPISLDANITAFRDGTSCDSLFPSGFSDSLCTRWDLKIGAGRLYFKGYLIFSGIVSLVSYFSTFLFIVGMAYRKRTIFTKKYIAMLKEEMAAILQFTKGKSDVDTETFKFPQENSLEFIAGIVNSSSGTNQSS